jgi:hypothetical protein
MQKCKLNGSFIYAFDVIGENNTILNDREKEWRRASEGNLLLCDECGHPVILKIKDLNKRKPHFAHKVINGVSHECQYSRESEEHIEGKRILYKHMQEQYDNIYSEIRHRFSKQCIADLYFVFEDSQKLVIEFQRLNTSIETWDRKHKFYKDNGINDVWIFSGKGEMLDKMQREFELNYYKRIVLNDLNDKIAFLDVDRIEITFVSKILCKDERNGRVVYDKIFSKTYPLGEVQILESGYIKSPFDMEYEHENERIKKEYESIIEKEKKDNDSFLSMMKNNETKRRIFGNITDHIRKDNAKVNTIKRDRPELKGLFGEIYDYEIKKAVKSRQMENLGPIFDKCRRDKKTLETVREILNSYIEEGYDYAALMLEKIEALDK